MKRIIALALFLLACTPTTALAEDPIILQVDADSYVRFNQKTTNFGSANVLRAGYSYDQEVQSFIRFDSPVAGDAVLKLYVERSNGGITRVYTATGAWAENTINWNNKPVIGAQVATFTSGWDQTVEVEVPVVEGLNTFAIRKYQGPADPGPTSSAQIDEVSRLASSESGNLLRRPQLTVTPAPPPPPPPPVCEGTAVPAGANLATVASAAPAGTTFCLEAGTYPVPSTVTLQDGDKLIGAGIEQTHILGTGAENMLTGTSGASIEVTGFRISGGQGDGTCAPNCGRAFRPTGDFWNIHHIRCFDNDNQCLGSGGARVMFDTVECDGNGFGSAFIQPKGRSSACIKQASTGGGDITVTNSYIHDNAWIGVWCDFCEDGPFIVENSTIVRNGKAGVSYEASGGLNAVDQAIVRNNIIQDNGDADNPNRISNVIPTALTCNSCAELTVEGNTFGGNVNVIHFVNARRAPWGDIHSVVIRNNTLNGDALNCTWATCTSNN